MPMSMCSLQFTPNLSFVSKERRAQKTFFLYSEAFCFWLSLRKKPTKRRPSSWLCFCDSSAFFYFFLILFLAADELSHFDHLLLSVFWVRLLAINFHHPFIFWDDCQTLGRRGITLDDCQTIGRREITSDGW